MVLTLALACAETAPTSPPLSRVDAVAAPPMRATAVEEFCDTSAGAATAPPFSLPELDAPAPAAATGWSWVNVWATWCGPCVAEMPMIRKWAEKLSTEGAPVDLRFLSVDAAAADLDGYRAKHADAPPTMRIKDFGLVAGWFAALGLDAGTPIPIHFFVDGAQKVRCIRAGAVNDADYAVIKKIITGG